VSGLFNEKTGIVTPMNFAEKLLAEEFVATVPGEAFGTDHHIRMSYAASMEDLTRGLDRLERFIGRYSA
jgi:aspartate aminotransferase